MQSQWDYKYNPNKSISENIEKLLGLLSFKNIAFITNTDFKNKNPEKISFSIIGIFYLVKIGELRSLLMQAINDIINAVISVTESDESIQQKKFFLLDARYTIKKNLLDNNIFDITLMDFKQHYVVYNQEQTESVEASLSNCKITPVAFNDFYLYQHVRDANINVLDSKLATMLEFINIESLKLNENNNSDSSKEIELLEVWLGLKECGFLDYLGVGNNKLLSEHRKKFFALFQLRDHDYGNRNRVIIKRSIPITPFLDKMIKKINLYTSKERKRMRIEQEVKK